MQVKKTKVREKRNRNKKKHEGAQSEKTRKIFIKIAPR